MKLVLDLHDIYNRHGDIDRALHAIIEEAIAKKAPLVEIIPGKGTGALKKRVLRHLPPGREGLEELRPRLRAFPPEIGLRPQPIGSTSAPLSRTSSCGSIGNTAVALPAAAQTTGSASSVSSQTVRIGLSSPRGGTPPML